MRQNARSATRGGGWILSSSNSIDSGADPENGLAMGADLRECTH